MAYKPLWDWMDKQEGRKKGSSTKAMEKEKDRQYPKDQAYQPSKSGGILIRLNNTDKKKKIAKKMKKDMSNRGLGSRFLKSKYAKDIPEERKEVYRKAWNIKNGDYPDAKPGSDYMGAR